MYTINDLFEKRSIVGKKIEELLTRNACTKTEVCQKCGISRPTLDRVIAGTITNKTNYEKHIEKILFYFEVTPNMLLGSGDIQYNVTRKIRKLMKISLEKIALNTSISMRRLEEIEAGEVATLAELREIAMYLAVSVNCLLEKNIFVPQIAELDLFVEAGKEKQIDDYSGFWGHIGIKLVNEKEYLWYPIVSSTRELVYNMLEKDRMVVPCMNNKVLYLNMNNIEEIIFSDFDRDQPDFVNWNFDIDGGDVPLVVYELLDDYLYGEEEDLSPWTRSVLKRILEKEGWTEEELENTIHLSNIYYSDGTQRPLIIDFRQQENVSEEIEMIYLYEETEFSSKFLICTENSGNEILININNISMMVMPLIDIENAIIEKLGLENE